MTETHGLVQDPKSGFWVEPAPSHCPNGHPLTGRKVLVSWHPCTCAGTAGHRTHTCLECGDITYDPPHAPGSWEGVASSGT
jgi:hypothetical protein